MNDRAIGAPPMQSVDDRIFMEQVRLLYKPLVPLVAVNLLVAWSLTWGLRHTDDTLALHAWVIAISAVQGYRLITAWLYRRWFAPPTAKRLAYHFATGSMLTGMLWGASVLLLFPTGSITHQMVMISMVIGLGAGAVVTHHAHLPTFYGFFLPLTLPLVARMLTAEDGLMNALGWMLLTYGAFMSYYGRVLNKALTDSLRLRFQNQQLTEDLREQKDQAERANIAKSKFLAAASHDLRQPLHALELFTSVLDQVVTTAHQRKLVGQIQSSVGALEGLFSALLDISRLDAGVLEPARQGFKLDELLERLRSEFAVQASQKGLALHWKSTDAVVRSDPTLLESILRNFISNAIRYTREGEVTVSCHPTERQVAIEVADTGPGIPASEQERIFDEFHQLSNPERDRNKGLGLGLAIVKRTAKLLGHPIGVESTPGSGARFTITVPTGDLTEPLPAQPHPQLELQENLTVLVIDDDRSVREGTAALLESWGCSVLTAADEAEAIAAISHHATPPSGIIADYRLRNRRTGIEALDAVQSHLGQRIPAVIITGDTAVDELREVDQSGYQVLHKPVPPARLRAFLRHLSPTEALG